MGGLSIDELPPGIVRGTDPRLSNARPPTAHTHTVGEVSGLTPEAIGAAPASHTHTPAAIGAAAAGEVVRLGRHTVAIPARGWFARAANGPTAWTKDMGSGVTLAGWAFDAANNQYIQWAGPLPRSWNRGSLAARVHWIGESGSGSVVWGLRGRVFRDGDSVAAFGGDVEVSDDLGSVNSVRITAETAAIVVAGAPADAVHLQLELYRNTGHGSDTLGAAAILLGIELYVTINAATDG